MIGWVDASGGVSGDMLLGACLDAGADPAAVQGAIDALGLPERLTITAEAVVRGGLAATRAVVTAEASRTHRRLGDVLALLERADPDVRAPATAVFRALADAEARVHRMSAEDVRFHEVGALDAIADVVGVVAALRALAVDRVVCSPIALGGGRATSAHGPIPVPGPAVLELLRAGGAPASGGPVDVELATPTGVALMVALAADFGPLPPLHPVAVGTGAGDRDPDGHANVTRLVVGAASAPELSTEVVIAANVDDLDPRLWPQVLADLLAAGASDAWLAPIVMKKGRPAHTLSVLAPPEHAERLEALMFRQTSTIGLRRHPVTKRALPRQSTTVEVYGEPVRVKVARLGDEVVSAAPEYDDVQRVAAVRGLPAKVVLAAAQAAASAAGEPHRLAEPP